ncbi:mitochondrial ribosome-associated GTPase 2 [Episyrphus balteatus]|uniref:mitochondrial ribosome-associated GTPase 2 n=1 Tax=Episyrphus balteatus TaxID=286459 RepID=UPI0024863A2B|nr:mitochondrial ribosome-associated GTPase 2 [Episyrphus balteatus]
MLGIISRNLARQLSHTDTTHKILNSVNYSQRVALRPKKSKSIRKEIQYFTDAKHVRVLGGKGGDGCINLRQVWCNERAGPDGGDGGNGGHIIFEASTDVNNYNHVTSILKADEGTKGGTNECHGRNASHTVVKVPVGTIIRNDEGKVVGDLDKERAMFVAARGGSGGKGNKFFATSLQQTPRICEYGADGEDLTYTLELRSMADVGFIGFPNAGKSTLLRAISRAKPKVASYPFTTLRPHIGMIQYDDYEQVAIADLPGLIPDSHKNKGLGIQFLKHAERCSVLMFVLDASGEEPWKHYEILDNEINQFSQKLGQRPRIIVANKIDAPDAEVNVKELEERLSRPVIGISAKMGTNLAKLLVVIREHYDAQRRTNLEEN